MSVTFGNAFILNSQTWSTFKATVSSKAMAMQYDDDGTTYTIFAVDSPIVYLVTLYKGSVPDAPGFSQSQNDSDKSDFEANWKTNANKPLDVQIPMTGSAGAGLVGFYGAYLPTAATSLAAVRASLFTEQTWPCRRSFSSTDGTDNASGSGARQIRLTYYDGQMNGPYVEDLYLSGTTTVNTVNTNIQFVEHIRCTLVGANGGNAGNVNMFATSSGAGGLIAQIPAGDGKTYYAHHYVRPGDIFSLRRLFINTSVCAGNVSVRNINPFVTGAFEDQVGTTFRALPGGAGSQFDFDGDMQVVGPARVTVYTKPDAATATTWFINFAWEEF